MTDDQIAAYYVNLLELQYNDQPNAIAHIQTLALALWTGQIYSAVQNAYTLGTAVGVQLDVLGKYVGASRNGIASSGGIVLDDADFLTLIYLAIIRNTTDGTTYGTRELIEMFIPGALLLFDYQDMRISYFVNTSLIPLYVFEMAINQGLLQKNMGVQLGTTVIAPIINNFFGFFDYLTADANIAAYGTPNHNNSPFNTYEDYNIDAPWLDYKDGVSV